MTFSKKMAGGKGAQLGWLRERGFPTAPFAVVDTAHFVAFMGSLPEWQLLSGMTR